MKILIALFVTLTSALAQDSSCLNSYVEETKVLMQKSDELLTFDEEERIRTINIYNEYVNVINLALAAKGEGSPEGDNQLEMFVDKAIDMGAIANETFIVAQLDSYFSAPVCNSDSLLNEEQLLKLVAEKPALKLYRSYMKVPLLPFKF